MLRRLDADEVALTSVKNKFRAWRHFQSGLYHQTRLLWIGRAHLYGLPDLDSANLATVQRGME